MSMTNILAVRYIWIDSLCIIQDSLEDWQHESATMDQVYRYAVCTVSADRAKDSSEGLFFRGLCLRPARVKVPGHGTFWLEKETINWLEEFSVNPIAQRAWTLQERILSPRILHFGAT